MVDNEWGESTATLNIVFSVIGILCHGGDFSHNSSYRISAQVLSWMIEIWMTSMSIIETKFGVFCILTFL